jgi:ABC-type multidrug transport system fused ATPase/permease subunit
MRDHPEVSLLDIFYSNMVIIWAGWYAGNNFYFMPDVVRSRQAASSLFEILEEEDEIQMQDKSASKKLTTPIHGNLSVNNLSFKYNPHDENVINNISFNIRKG